jgi:hypothetical protein
VIWEIILCDFWGDILRLGSRLAAARMRMPELENLNPRLFELRSLRPRNLPDQKKRKIISQITLSTRRGESGTLTLLAPLELKWFTFCLQKKPSDAPHAVHGVVKRCCQRLFRAH